MNKTLKVICNTMRLMTIVILGIFIRPQDFQACYNLVINNQVIGLVVSFQVSLCVDTIGAI